MMSRPSVAPAGAVRGGGEIRHAQVGGVVVQRRAILGEQPAELGERGEVAAVGESRDAAGTPGPGGNQPAFRRVDGGERPGRMPAAAPESARMARTVAVITSADAATMSMWPASAMSAASAADSSASSQRPVSIYAHPSAVRAPPLVPRTPGARSRCRPSCSKPTARSDSSRRNAAEAGAPQGRLFEGEPAILRRTGRSWFLPPIGSVLARIQSFSALTSTRWPPARGRPACRCSRRSRVRRTASRLAGAPDW